MPNIFGVSYPAPPRTNVRINCGSASAYVDPDGYTWIADAYYTGGDVNTSTGGTGLGAAERYQTTFQYDIPCNAGTYTVELWFRESFFSSNSARLFSVSINGTTFIKTGFDVYKTFGKGILSMVSCPNISRKSNGTIQVAFSASVDNAAVSAIRLY